MKYMLLIHQGSTPLPGTAAWDQLTDAERQAVFTDYGAINNTPGVTPGEQMQSPETATMVQVQDGIAYAASGTGLQAYDLLTGVMVQTLALPGANLTGLAREGSMLYTIDAGGTLRAIDISGPAKTG